MQNKLMLFIAILTSFNYFFTKAGHNAKPHSADILHSLMSNYELQVFCHAHQDNPQCAVINRAIKQISEVEHLEGMLEYWNIPKDDSKIYGSLKNMATRGKLKYMQSQLNSDQSRMMLEKNYNEVLPQVEKDKQQLPK